MSNDETGEILILIDAGNALESLGIRLLLPLPMINVLRFRLSLFHVCFRKTNQLHVSSTFLRRNTWKHRSRRC